MIVRSYWPSRVNDDSRLTSKRPSRCSRSLRTAGAPASGPVSWISCALPAAPPDPAAHFGSLYSQVNGKKKLSPTCAWTLLVMLTPGASHVSGHCAAGMLVMPFEQLLVVPMAIVVL